MTSPGPSQYFLPMKDLDRALRKGVRVRLALRAWAKDVGFKVVADLWGCDEATVSLKLDERNRHFVKVHEWLTAIEHDHKGGILAAICEEVGYETPERKQDPATEGDRLLAAAGELFAPDVVELLRRKAGL